MSGGQIGTAVGFVAGFFLPGGPQLWAGIGGAIGSAVDPTVIDGPGIGEVPQQTSQEGIARPIVYARSQPIMGCIILTAPINIVTTFEEQGKSGPKVKVKTAYRHYCIGVCPGEADLLKAWRNGKLVYDATDPGMAGNNAEFLKYARWHRGTYTQDPDPDQEAKHGVGVVHGFRGTAYLSLFEENVQDNGGAMSQWTFVVSTTASVSTPDEVDHPQTYQAPSLTAPGPYLSVKMDGTPYALTATSTNDTDWIVEPGESYIVSDYDNDLVQISSHSITNPGSVFGSPSISVVGIDENGWGVSLDGSYGYCKLISNGATVADLRPQADSSSGWWYAESFYAPEYGGLIFFDSNYVYIGVRETGGTGVRWNSIFKWPLSSSGGAIVPASGTLANITAATTGPGFWWHLSRQGFVRYINEEGGFKKFNSSFGDEGEETLPTAIATLLSNPLDFNGFGIDEALDLAVFCHSADTASVYRLSSGELLADFELEGAGNPGTPGNHANCDTRVVFNNAGIYIQRRQKFYRITVLTLEGTLLLSEVVADLCVRANMQADKVDVTDLAPIRVRGFTVTNRYPCYSALQSLSKAFFFSPSNSDGKVKFKRLGADSVATILESDMIDDGDRDDPDNSRRGDTISVPRVLNWVYYDIAGGLAADMQSSERPEDGKNVGHQTVECSVIQSADEAATACAKAHAMMDVGQKGEIEFSLPDNYLFLTESDPVIVQDGAKMVRAVIQKVDTDDGEQRYRCVRDRQSIHTMEVEGIPAAPVTPPPSSVKGPTLLAALDIPLWRDEDDKLGLYVAVSGIYNAWPGATVEMSLDGGASYPFIDTTNVPAVMGSLITELGDHPAEYPDTVNSCRIAVSTPGSLLEGTNLAGILNGRNLALIGEELINFATPDEISPGVWEISLLLRGRKGSGSSHHDIGERFLLLDGAVFFRAAQLAWRNRTLTFRGLTYGAPIEDATITTMVFVGKNQTERRVASLKARRDAGDAIIEWLGVGRLGAGMNAAQGLYFAGYRLTLTDGVVTQIFDQTELTKTTSLSAFTGPVTVRVQQRNSITGLGPEIEVTI